MGKYKVGDKVFLEGEIKRIDYCEHPYEVLIADLPRMHFSEDELRDASKTYEDGLNDAWELARKLYNFTCNKLEDIYGVDGGFYELIRDYAPQDALEILEAYEKSQQIQVGDVIYADDEPDSFGVVTWVANGAMYVLWDDGSNCWEGVLSDFHKTGRTVDIEHLLEQIRGNE